MKPQFFFCLFALIWAQPLMAETDPLGGRGRILDEVQYQGEALPSAFREKINELRNSEIRKSDLRNILIWLHENGVELLIELDVRESRGGKVSLLVKTRKKQKIQSISFVGNSVADNNLLLGSLDLKVGYDFDESDIVDSLKKISLFYSKQGYLSSEASYSFDSSTGALTFRVSEGEPTLLHGLGISPLTVVERKDLRQRYEAELREAFGLLVGQRIQRDRVLDGIQKIKDWLRDHDFLMAKDPQLEYRVDEQGRVSLFVNITYGSRIRFGFRGNYQFSYRELMALVGEVKEVSSGSDYLASVRRRITEAYKEIGFAKAQISTLVQEDSSRGIRNISLIVSEGKKVPIKKISIEGIYSMTSEDAISKFKSLSSRLVQRGFLHETGINKAADLLAEHLKSTGYLSSKVELVKIEYDQKQESVNVELLMNEGIQTIVADRKISGLSSISEQEIWGLLKVESGKPFDIFSFERGLLLLKERLQASGHLSAQISNESSDSLVIYSKDNSQVSLNLQIDEGPIFRVGEVVVRGNQKTHARVILRELPFVSGDILTAPLLSEAEDYIRQLNLFSSVILRPIDKPGSADIKDILVLVEEGEAGSFDIVPGFRSDLGLRLAFEFGYLNLGGWNRSVSARAVFNRRLDSNYRFPEYSFFLGFREPYLANWRVVFTSNLSLFRRSFPSFDASVSRITAGVKRDLIKYLSGSLEYSYERVKISNVDETRSSYKKSDEKLDLIGAMTPGFVFDSRNNLFNPTRGIQSVNRFEVASRFFGSKRAVGYYRATSFNSAYINFFDEAVLALAMNFGWERSNVLNEPVPIYKLFRLGGIGSVRGYGEDEIRVDTKKDIKGILGSLNSRAELRVPVAGAMGAALFADAGNLYVDRFTFEPSKLRSSVGAGLRYNTPVGPVVLDFAWKLQKDDTIGDTDVRDSGRNPMRIHFSIGSF